MESFSVVPIKLKRYIPTSAGISTTGNESLSKEKSVRAGLEESGAQ
jgi:hypothetical protein